MCFCDFPCADVDCGTLGNPANGMVSVSTTTYNSVATYSCNPGYALTGDDMRTCLDTKSWSGSEPTCIGELQCFRNPLTTTNLPYWPGTLCREVVP